MVLTGYPKLSLWQLLALSFILTDVAVGTEMKGFMINVHGCQKLEALSGGKFVIIRGAFHPKNTAYNHVVQKLNKNK